MIKTLGRALCLTLLLTGCGGVFDSKIAAPQTYVLRLPPAGAPASEAGFGTVLVQRPETSRCARAYGRRGLPSPAWPYALVSA